MLEEKVTANTANTTTTTTTTASAWPAWPIRGFSLSRSRSLFASSLFLLPSLSLSFSAFTFFSSPFPFSLFSLFILLILSS